MSLQTNRLVVLFKTRKRRNVQQPELMFVVLQPQPTVGSGCPTLNRFVSAYISISALPWHTKVHKIVGTFPSKTTPQIGTLPIGVGIVCTAQGTVGGSLKVPIRDASTYCAVLHDAILAQKNVLITRNYGTKVNKSKHVSC